MEIKLRGQGTSQVTLNLLEKYPNKVELKLGEILEQRGLTQGDLHRMTGIRAATLSELINAKKQGVNLIHIVTIMIALRITDIRELVSITFDKEVVETWKEEMEHYSGGMTHKQKKEVEENIKILYT